MQRAYPFRIRLDQELATAIDNRYADDYPRHRMSKSAFLGLLLHVGYQVYQDAGLTGCREFLEGEQK